VDLHLRVASVCTCVSEWVRRCVRVRVCVCKCGCVGQMPVRVYVYVYVYECMHAPEGQDSHDYTLDVPHAILDIYACILNMYAYIYMYKYIYIYTHTYI